MKGQINFNLACVIYILVGVVAAGIAGLITGKKHITLGILLLVHIIAFTGVILYVVIIHILWP